MAIHAKSTVFNYQKTPDPLFLFPFLYNFMIEYYSLNIEETQDFASLQGGDEFAYECDSA